MLFRLFLLFTLVPLFELFVLIRIGGLIGAGPTILLVLATGAAGAWMARREGLRSWNAVQQELREGRFPAEELLHSLLILVAGIVLVTPGVFTDLAGILLLVRPLRGALIARLRERFASRIRSGGTVVSDGATFRMFWSGPAGPGAREEEDVREVRDAVYRPAERGTRPGGDGGDSAVGEGAAPGSEEGDAGASRKPNDRPRVIEL